MKKLLATTAIVFVGFASAASAQSVLERVLTKIDNASNLAQVNGTFANIAENIGGAGMQTIYVDDSGATSVILTEAEYNAQLEQAIAAEIADAAALLAAAPTGLVTAEPNPADYDLTTLAGQTAYNDDKAAYADYLDAVDLATQTATAALTAQYQPQEIAVAGLAGVDGSITNLVDGIGQATQQAIASADVSAIEWNMPTLEWGDMATTALGAVNTGEITLGVNQAVDQAKTTSTGAYSAVVNQLGGAADTGALVLNVASNMTGINGSISNTMNEVNGAVGNLSTTALGAVNTGTITSGVNAAVTGIIGTSGTSQ